MESRSMDIKQRILEQAQSLFMKYGVRNVTMDDIARDLGISKKTIYQSFNNKAGMVYDVSKAYFDKEKCVLEEIAVSAENAIDELVKIMRHTAELFRNMSPTLAFEIQRYYPQAWKVFQHYKSDYIRDQIRGNLERGKKEGLYRKELDDELVSYIRAAQIDISFFEELIPYRKFDYAQIQVQMFELYLYGISTRKGQKLINKYLNREEDE